ncbi:MAG: hypothetical protein SGJ10_02560 [Bacteroidota bacterium]|nr:hypothetical protein [Bacteroidota bacterium]
MFVLQKLIRRSGYLISLLALSSICIYSCTCNKEKVTESVTISFEPSKEAAVERALTEFTFKNYSEKKGAAVWHAYDSTVLASFGSNDFNDTLTSFPIKGLYTLNQKKILIKLFATAPTDYVCDGCQPVVSMCVLKEKATNEYIKVKHHFLSSSGNLGKMGKLEVSIVGDTIVNIDLPSLDGVNKWSYHYKNGLSQGVPVN